MPIRKSISAAGQRVARQSALKLFTDRNHERELLRHFFERLARVHWVHDVRPETLYAQGDLAGARKLQELVLEVRARLLGKEHPNTLTSMNNLAQTLYTQGDLAGARKLQELVLEAMARLLGKEHPNTLTSMLNLAQMLQAEGDLAGAERLYRLALEGRNRVLG